MAMPEDNRREKDITGTLATEGLEDMEAHFLLQRRRCCRDGKMWSMLQEGREVRSRMDYILGTDCRLFRNVSVWDPRRNSDHYMVLVCLHSASLTEHKGYLRGRKKLPLKPPSELTREDEVFADLRRAVPKARVQEARKNEWISTETWRLVDKRVSALRDPAKGKTIRRTLGRANKAILTADRRRCEEEAGAEVEALVGADPPLIQEAWHMIHGVVQGCGRSCSAARPSYDREDNGGEGRTVQLCTTPGGEHSHRHKAV